VAERSGDTAFLSSAHYLRHTAKGHQNKIYSVRHRRDRAAPFLQKSELEREFAREYHLITRNDRLDAVAKDVVTHFTGRGFQGKAMMICIDKATAIRMYDKVKQYWGEKIAALQAERILVKGDERTEIEECISRMEETDMAVVVSQGQNEISELAEKGLDIRPHRRRIVDEDLETKFKNPDDPFRLVFVCAMWMTGFDVPSCSI
jgi:type I restriction enzyme R subunit